MLANGSNIQSQKPVDSDVASDKDSIDEAKSIDYIANKNDVSDKNDVIKKEGGIKRAGVVKNDGVIKKDDVTGKKDDVTGKNDVTEPTTEDVENQVGEADGKLKVFKRRWPILFLFCALSTSNAYQWIHLNIVFNVTLTHYASSLPRSETQANLAVDWLSMIYMLAYAVFMLPAAWVFERFGLRWAAICAAVLNFAGALIKCFTAPSGRFWLLFIGQTLCASSQSFILGFPAPLAATWFGADELSTATSLGVFGNQIGVAIGFVLPPQIVRATDQGGAGSSTEKQLLVMFIIGACVTGAILILVLIVFPSQPPLPPTLGQLAIREGRAEQMKKADGTEPTQGESLQLYLASLRRLLTNVNFVLLTVSYGINTGTFYGLSTLLSPIVRPEFEPEPSKTSNRTAGSDGYMARIDAHIGWAAFTMVLAGIAGSVLAGIVLDKTKEFKLTTLIIYILSCVSTVLFTATLPAAQLWLVYLSMFLLGLFMTGYLPVGFEFAAEITYPENESLSSGFLNASAQLWGILLTISVRAVIDNVSGLAGNIMFCGLLAVGSVLTALIKSDLRRQRANQQTLDLTEPAESEGESKVGPAEPSSTPVGGAQKNNVKA